MKIYTFSDDAIPHWENPSNCYNKEFKWWASDNEENYDPVNNNYGPDDIIYKLNEKGFRSDSFDIQSDKRIVFIGCSFTFGVGLPLHHTWNYILLDLIKKETGYNIPFWNLGLGGVGLDAIVRMFYHYGLKLKPQLVFGYFPEYRRELYFEDNNHLIQYGASYPEQNFDNLSYLVDPRIVQYETEKNLCFLDLMLKSINAKLIHNNWANPGKEDDVYRRIQIPHKIKIVFDQKARDRAHSGYEANFKFAHQIFEQYKDVIIDSLKD